MTWDDFFTGLGVFASVLFCLLTLIGTWCHLRDKASARAYARKQAARASNGPPGVYLAFVIEDRLTAPTEAERAILEARSQRRRKVDEDIEAITRQIERNQ